MKARLKKWMIPIGSLLLILGALNRFTTCSIPYRDPTKNEHSLAALEAAARFATVFGADIVFYGKVQDQHGKPIEGAIVDCSFNQFPQKSKLRATTSSDGTFAVKGNGASLYVTVKKEGFHHILATNAIKGKSEAGFDYGQDFGSGIHKPDKDNPVIFTLFKPGVLEPLYGQKRLTTPLFKNNEISGFFIYRDDQKFRQVSLRLFVDESKYNKQGIRKYDWRVEITAENGEVAVRENDLDFVAPETGYEKMKVIEMKDTMDDYQWQKMASGKYWVRFEDDTYGRFNLECNSLGRFAEITEAYSNPKPGSRNLESEPKVWGF
jgi:hypothetical protein